VRAGLKAGATSVRDDLQVRRSHAAHAELAERGPQGRRHRRLIGERPEIASLTRSTQLRCGQFEHQAHRKRGTEAFLRGVDAPLDEERRAHAQRDVERRHEAQIEPVRSFEREALAERAAERVRGHEDPLGSGRPLAAELCQP